MRQVGLGRLLPLGRLEHGTWITESAACGVLSRATNGLSGIRVGTMRIRLVDPQAASEPSVPAPFTALPPGLLRIEAEFSAPASQPLPDSAEGLREALFTAASERLGLEAGAIDLHVTNLLENPTPKAGPRPDTTFPPPMPEPGTPGRSHQGHACIAGQQASTSTGHRLAALAAAVPGVSLMPGLAGTPMPRIGQTSAPSVRITDSNDPPGRHVQIELATDETHRALDVALSVRTAVATAATADAPGPVTVAILVTAIEPAKE
ncbi:nucleopolyhedrovirus P10 family protein [Streptomyces adustus]|nr:nucleopolyhedrovirus P10 family protein [Streptomyces adustus]